jgi:hypothetical protein
MSALHEGSEGGDELAARMSANDEAVRLALNGCCWDVERLEVRHPLVLAVDVTLNDGDAKLTRCCGDLASMRSADRLRPRGDEVNQRSHSFSIVQRRSVAAPLLAHAESEPRSQK